MFDFRQKRKIKNIMSSRITQTILLLVTFFVLLSTYSRYLIARDMSDRRTAAEAEIGSLRDRQINLEQEVKYLTNERGIEAEMRRKFDIVREGEKLVIILDDESSTESHTNIETEVKPEKRPWYRFW